ncbi:MAG: helix-turn-helix domain-containing protein [Roseivirga sp.]|nr:helix-turn-helix domain-containing protein [Roseivirga sp.]
MINSNHIQISTKVYLLPEANELVFKTDMGDDRVRIEPLMVQLLKAIADKKNRLVTRQELVEEVWEGNIGVGNKALTKNIYKIRKVFEQQGVECAIETIPKKGYRLKVTRTKSKPISYKPWMIAAAVVVAFIAMKLVVPGLFHGLSHGMMH